MALDVDLAQIEAIYDSLNARIRADLQDDYDCKKINGATFADTWAKLMSTVVNSSVQAAISLATKETPTDILVKLEQIEVMKQDIKNKQSTEKLTDRQLLGFDDNARQKLYEAQMNAWALMYSSGLVANFPDHINNTASEKLVEDIKASIGVGSNPIGYLDRALTATEYDGTSTTLSWGSAIGATTYILYAGSYKGQLSGFPKIVAANGTETISLPLPEEDTTMTYDFKLIAYDTTRSYFRESKTTLTLENPAPPAP